MLCHLICEWYIDGSLVRAIWEGKKLISRWAMGKLFGRSGICYHRQKNAFRAHEIVTVESFTKNMESRPLSRIKIKTFICRFRPRTQTLHMIAGRIICISKTKWSNSISIWLWLLNISQMVFFSCLQGICCDEATLNLPLSFMAFSPGPSHTQSFYYKIWKYSHFHNWQLAHNHTSHVHR